MSSFSWLPPKTPETAPEPEFMAQDSTPTQGDNFTFVQGDEGAATSSKHVKFTWNSLEEAKKWISDEEERNLFRFAIKVTEKPEQKKFKDRKKAPKWKEKINYVCSRGSTGGVPAYTRKHNWQRKKPSKRCGCKCRLVLTTFSDSEKVMGLYTPEHNHALGAPNARFTSLSADTRLKIEAMLRSGIDAKSVLDHIRGDIFNEANIGNLRSQQPRRTYFVTRADVRRIEKKIEEEKIRLSKQDGSSVAHWVEQLRSEGHHVFFKASCDPAPAGSNLDPNAFVLIIQTKYQLLQILVFSLTVATDTFIISRNDFLAPTNAERWVEHGKRFAGIDATHNTTQYKNMSLFTLLVRDRWTHGFPCAWMISSNATEETISCFLQDVKDRFPDIEPRYFMSDKDPAQLNTIKRIYPGSTVNDHSELWNLLKAWIRITSQDEFEKAWERICELAPGDFIAYLKQYWMGDVKMWSAVHRADRNIFESCDTNMLVEAWHHLLKSKFMQGKRNRRCDHLIYILVKDVISHYIQKHFAQEHGMEGPDAEVAARLKIQELGAKIDAEDIEQSILPNEEHIFTVRSQTNADIFYTVDLDAYACTCPSFPTVLLCKHIHAVQLAYDEICTPVLVSEMDITPSDTFEPVEALGGVEETLEAKDSLSSTANHTEETQALDQLLSSLSSLIGQLKGIHPSQIDLGQAQALQTQLNAFKLKAAADDILPERKKIAPNEHNQWSKTAEIMGAPVKGKRVRQNTDPYAGGERPGKKVREHGPPGTLDTASGSSTSLAPTALGTQFVATTNTVNAPFDTPTTTLQLTADSSSTSNNTLFDPSAFDLKNSSLLESLKRPELSKLCAHYGILQKGKNADLVRALKDLVKE
ncbi:hypothetical protein NMY22_g9127 [Coprinellus aureogranulatus]|nr:hypothetical protein NMY22_g9127 [Coprinellus aureogranulatus]